MTTRLSVNINKVATLRNSRGGAQPSLEAAVEAIVSAGGRGITVHPRADERHITHADIFDTAAVVRRFPGVEYNIEGDPRPDLIDAVCRVQPDQCTLVPVRPGEVTSEAGWDITAPNPALTHSVQRLRDLGIRVSLFVDPAPDTIRWAHDLGADRVELYTEPYARAFALGPGDARLAFDRYQQCATAAAGLGLGINAGHDLDLENLLLFRELAPLDEVSIGHALISRALFLGLENVVQEYLALLA